MACKLRRDGREPDGTYVFPVRRSKLASLPALASFLLAICLLSSSVSAQPIIIDHTSYPLWTLLAQDDAALQQALSTPVEFTNASVGANIRDGLICLESYANAAAASSSCRTVKAGLQVEDWSGPLVSDVTYHLHPGGGTPDLTGCTGWQGGLWTGLVPCWKSFLLTENRYQAYGIVGALFNYSMSSWSDSMANFWTNRAGDHDAYDVLNFQLAIAPTKVLWFGTSIMKSTDATLMQRLADFNAAGRTFIQANGGVYFDIGAIEAHGWDGTPATGVNGLPIIHSDWNNEAGAGGHLTYGSAKVRMAKLFLVAVARLNGWDPSEPPPPPPTPLVLSQPPTLTPVSSNGLPVAVPFALPTLSGGVLPYTGPTCTPLSGSAFSVGTTPVTCAGSDAASQSASVTFTVTVTYTAPPPPPPPPTGTLFLSSGDCRVTQFTPTDWMITCSAVVASTVTDGTAVITLRGADGSTETKTIPVVRIP
jgi:hypothetical protein